MLTGCRRHCSTRQIISPRASFVLFFYSHPRGRDLWTTVWWPMGQRAASGGGSWLLGRCTARMPPSSSRTQMHSVTACRTVQNRPRHLPLTLTAWFLPKGRTKKNCQGDRGLLMRGFYRLDSLPVTQPTVSEHWRDELCTQDILLFLTFVNFSCIILIIVCTWQECDVHICGFDRNNLWLWIKLKVICDSM